MGGWKKMQQESNERGFDEVGKYVCSECIGNEHLKEVIANNLQKDYCDYCEENNKSAPVEVIVGKILEKCTPYADMYPHCANNIFSSRNTRDLLHRLYGEKDLPDDLLEDVIKSIMHHNDVWYLDDCNEN